MKNIVIFKHGLLGDLIVAIPALHLIRQQFADAYILLFIERLPNQSHLITKDLLIQTGLVNEVRDFSTATTRELFSLTRKLWTLRKNALFAVNLERIGWSKKRELFCLLMGYKVYGPGRLHQLNLNVTNNIAHQLYGLSYLIRNHNIETLDTSQIRYPKLSVGFATDTFYNWKSNNPIYTKYSGIVLLGIWSNMDSKRWPIDRFLVISKHFISKHNLLPVCIGGKNSEEIKAARFITDNSDALSVVGDMSICESFEFFKHAKLYVGNDTGAMHLAAFSGIPCISIFSARESSNLWYPIGSQLHQVLKSSPPCAGCQLSTCKIPNDRCVDAISCEDVITTADNLIESHLHI